MTHTRSLADLDDRTRGPLLTPGDEGYDDARAVWNARVDSEPAAVLRCSGVADVRAGVDAARELDLPLSVKGGGHHVSGSAVRDGALTLGLGRMDGVRVDPGARTARVGPGATWGDVDHETTAFGLAVPGGQDPNIGVPGLTLGGGVGWLSRKHGLTCDNLLSADVVTADGELVHAGPDTNPDLFWALRGGGGGFGVVTSFEFQLHPVDTVFAGSLIHPVDAAGGLFRKYCETMADAPRELRLLYGSMVLPPADYFPESVHGDRVAIVIACYAGPAEAGERVLADLRSFGDPVIDSLRERPYEAFQSAGESQGAARTHLRSQYLATLPDAAIETVVDYAAEAPSDGATVFVSPRGGAETDPPADATAYPHRDATHHLLIEARWDDPARDADHVAWVDRFHEAVQPYTTGAAAMNFLPADEPESRVRAAYGGNYERLVDLKREWDPANLFENPHTVDPRG